MYGYFVGTVSIVNLQDITTQHDLENKTAVFAFEIHPKFSPSEALGYSIDVQWTQLRYEFGGRHSSTTYFFPPEGVQSCATDLDTNVRRSVALELVGAGSYRLTFAVAWLDPGPLSIRISVSLNCLHLITTHNSCPSCTEWRYTSQTSNKINISSKRGI